MGLFDGAAAVRRAIGRDDVPFEIIAVKPWRRSEAIAKQYRAGRILLAGAADLARSLDRPRAPGRPVGKQLVVPARERGRAERRHQCNLVARVVHRPAERQQIPDLLAAIDQRCTLHAIPDAGAVEGCLELGEPGPSRDEDGDIAHPGRTRPTGGVVDRPGTGAHRPIDDGGARL